PSSHHRHLARRTLPSFPTRRSSDLHVEPHGVISGAALPQEALRCAHKNSLFSPCHAEFGQAGLALADRPRANFDERQHRAVIAEDRKSTRLNSSHGSISYAVFCLKK